MDNKKRGPSTGKCVKCGATISTNPITPCRWCVDDNSEKPWAVSEDVMDIDGHSIRCYVLNDGRRVLNADDVEKFFGASW